MVKTILEIKKSNTFKNEFGRSMVEMLGVLAIVGVLSVGGILGYRYAMDKHAANALINDVWVEAVHVAPQAIKKNADLKLTSGSDTGKTTANYTMRVKYETTGNYDFFVLSVEKVPSKICQQIENIGWTTAPTEIYTGTTIGLMDCVGVDGEVVVNFVFNSALDGSAEGRWESDSDPCKGGEMIGDDCCPAGSTAKNGQCCKAMRAEGYGGENCCPAGQESFEDPAYYGWTSCCPVGSSGWSADLGRCCNADEVAMDSFGFSYCCPPDSNGHGFSYSGCCKSPLISIRGNWGEPMCCLPGTTVGTIGSGCCQPGEIAIWDSYYPWVDYCCSSDSPGHASDPLNEHPDWEGTNRCCTSEETVVWGEYDYAYCCPKGSTSYDRDTKTCS